ncbi:hypothetical protein DEA8626_04011 [Defluviimonas aquaemixtae]|uniref:Glyoxylase CFP32 n=1 Tax=Albidovulum aquaemixtae TaxID=1542388 RepID=A0A2R8BNG9_9RHOB|nr:VOC family protein [Defluviimonas aquaemixtae]SPH24978.1 hypothetical protein DEA8626_04011 [Defluviimonas aquaemixtae]
MGQNDVRAGRPVRLELNAQRVTAAMDFYGALFGWTCTPLHVAPWGSIPLIANGDRVFGNQFMAMGAFAVAKWMIWFSGDLELAEQAIKRGGGETGRGIYSLGELGQLLDARDPAGNAFSLIRLRTHPPEHDSPGDPCLAEFWGPNVSDLAGFYADVFGFQSASTARGAKLSDGEDPRLFFRDTEFDMPRPCWIPYFRSTSVGGDCERARRAGAIVQVHKENVEDIGELVVLADPAGAFFGLVDPVRASASG